jgi:cell division septal protein FtsQ
MINNWRDYQESLADNEQARRRERFQAAAVIVTLCGGLLGFVYVAAVLTAWAAQ